MKLKANLFNYAKQKGFDTKSILEPVTLNKLENLIDKKYFDWFIAGEKIDKNNNPIWLLADNKGNKAHFYISKLGGCITYQSLINLATWC